MSRSNGRNRKVKLEDLVLEVGMPLLNDDGKVYAHVCLVDVIKVNYARYQRKTNKFFTEKVIGKDFCDHIVGSPLLSFRDNKLWVYDGRQRIHGRIASGGTNLYCEVHLGLTYQDEAEFFLRLNSDRRGMKGWIKFFAALEAKKEKYCHIWQIITDLKMTTSIHPNVTNGESADITVATALVTAYDQLGIGGLRKMLSLINSCWRTKEGPVQKNAKNLEFLRGFIQFLKEYAGLEYKALHLVLSRTPAEEIRQLAFKKRVEKTTNAKQYRLAFEELFGYTPPPYSTTIPAYAAA